MSMQHLDLGKARFVSTKANVSVEIHASAGLHDKNPYYHDLTQGVQCVQLDIHQDIWICKSHEFHLSFIISSEGDAAHDTSTGGAILADIGTRIEAAQLWRQLHLQPTLFQPASSTDNSPDLLGRNFLLALRDDRIDPTHTQTASRTPSQHSSTDLANLRAPDPIPTIELVSVLISLRFGHLSLDDGESLPGTEVGDTLLQSEHHEVRSQSVSERSPSGLECLLRYDGFGPWKSRSTMKAVECHQSVKSFTERTTTRRPSIAIGLLTDIAVRSLISPSPMRPPAGIKTCGENTMLPLARLAPAVFVPGYGEAIQERMQFISTIAKFLAQFLHYSGQTTKIEFSTNSRAAILDKPALREKNITEHEAVLRRHLWMTLVNGLKNVESARKLKPLYVASTSRTREPQCRTFESFLEAWHVQGQDASLSCCDSDFDQLDFDEEETSFDSGDESFSDMWDDILSRPQNEFDQATKNVPDHFLGEFSELLSSSPLEDGDLGATSNPARSILVSQNANLCEYISTDAFPGDCLRRRASKDLRTKLDSSDSQRNEATQICNSTMAADGMIGGIGSTHAYVSRMHPSYTSEEIDDSRDESLLFEHFDRHELDPDRPISQLYESFPAAEEQDLIDTDEVRFSTVLSKRDQDIKMPSYEKSNRSSLNELLGDDHLLWQMWTKRRPSMIQTDEDMLEMQAMYAQDPDMRLLDTQKTVGDENGDDYMLDSEASNASSINSALSMSGDKSFVFPYEPNPAIDHKHNHHHQLHKDTSARSPQRGTSTPASGRKLSRGQSFLKRLSGGRSSMEETSTSSRPLTRDEPRDIEIKRRKTLADYAEDNEMLLR